MDKKAGGSVRYILLLLLVNTAYAQKYWESPPDLYINTSNSLLDITPAVEYSIWQWQMRVGVESNYRGTTEITEAGQGQVVYVWPTLLEYLGKFSPSTRAVTSYKYYVDSGRMHSATVYINPLYVSGVLTACGALTILHETSHSLGLVSHNDFPDSLMYPSISHCRYVLTPDDIASGYDACFAEVTPIFDLYIPDIQGKRVFLKNEGNNIWRLDYLSEDMGGVCTTSYVDDDLNLYLDDLRGLGGSYAAKFMFVDGLVWRLDSYEGL